MGRRDMRKPQPTALASRNEAYRLRQQLERLKRRQKRMRTKIRAALVRLGEDHGGGDGSPDEMVVDMLWAALKV